MKTKKALSILVLIFLIYLVSPIIVSAQPVSCCRIRDSLKMSTGSVATGTVYIDSALTNSRACNYVSLCDCYDSTIFINGGCYLEGDSTIGGTEMYPSGTCSQLNNAGVPDKIPDYYTGSWGIICVLNGISNITNWTFYILVVVSSLLTIYGGFLIAIAGGDPNKVSSGRNYILYAMIGFAVALLANAIPSITRTMLGV